MNARIEQIAAVARQRVIERVRGRIADAIPDVSVAATQAGIELSGRGLVKRMLSDARLRWIGGLLR